MRIKKSLLLSAAIPFVALPLTLQAEAGAAQPDRGAAAMVVAQSDAADGQGNEVWKKKHHGQTSKQEGQGAKQQNGHQPQHEGQGRASKAPPKEKPNGGQAHRNAAEKPAPKKAQQGSQEKQVPANGGQQQTGQAPQPKREHGKHARQNGQQRELNKTANGNQPEPNQARQPASDGQAKQPGAAATSQGSAAAQHMKKRPNGQKARQQGSQPQNAAEPQQSQAQQPKRQQPHGQQDGTEQKKRSKHENAAKPQQPPAQENAAKPQQPASTGGAGNAAGQKPANQAVAPQNRKSTQTGGNGSAQGQQPANAGGQSGKTPPQPAGQQQPVPEQPTRNVVVPTSKGGQPERFKMPHGAPVLDSAKENNGPARQRTNGAAAQGQVQGQAAAGAGQSTAPQQPVHIQSAEKIQGKPVNAPPRFRLPQNAKVEKRTDNRVILNIDNRTVIENNDYGRLSHNARDVRYEQLSNGNTRQVVVRPNGVRIITIRDEYGDIVHRSRIGVDGRETVLIYTPDGERRDRRFYRDPSVDLPPIRLTEPVDQYVLEGGRADERQYVIFLEKPPIERIPHVYTLDQVRYSARLRDMMPRIDLDTITFASGSSQIGPQEAQSLQVLAQAIHAVLRRDPGQVFLIEGHTDAVGSAESNLILSDQRAEAVASVLTQDFDVPPENLVTQGYGEQYLKIDTQGPERANRRVTVRRITPLVRPDTVQR